MRTTVTAAIGTLLCIAACRDLGPDKLGAEAETSASLAVKVSLADAPEVMQVRLRVTAADLVDALWFSLITEDSVARGTAVVPAGQQRTFTLQALDAANVLRYEGNATMNVSPGANPPLSILMTAVNQDGEVPIIGEIGRHEVTVTPAVDSLLVGEHGRLVAIVHDPWGALVSGAVVSWESLAPATATVDSSGEVSALAVGQATIVAHYGAESGTGVIHVLASDVTPPVVSNGQPTGTLAAGTTQTKMSATTNESATCRWGTSSSTSYSDLTNTFSTTGGTAHSTTLSGLSDGQSYTRYIRCRDAAGNANTSSYTISFDVAMPSDVTPPVISDGQPSGTLAAGTTQATMSVATDEAATCKWGTSSVTAYADLANTFTTTGGTSHSTTLTGLADGQSYTRYVRCQDVAGNANGSSHTISFSVAGSGEGITGITFDWASYRNLAPGSDGWPLTWCEDGHQYTSWGDGGGFGGNNNDGRVSLGFGRIEGDYPGFTGFNVWGGKDPEHPATFEGKVESMLCINGILYGLLSAGSNQSGWDYKEVVRSANKGASWSIIANSRLVGDAPGAPGAPFYIQYGQNYGANTDGYVYIFSIRIADPNSWEVQKPGVTWLARAPVAGEAFMYPANWQWVTGFNGTAPVWGAMANRVSVLQDPDGFMRGSAIYNPSLDRYLMVTNHTARNQGNIAIWEAPEPWGPWTSVLKESGWPQGGEVPREFAFGTFSPKWLDGGGNCVLVWFRPDSWNSVSCQLQR
jgi:hypothetical protein